MGSLWLESVLISDPGDGDDGTVGFNVRVGSTGDGSSIFRGDLLLGAGFFYLDAMAGLKAVGDVSMISGQVFCCLLST